MPYTCTTLSILAVIGQRIIYASRLIKYTMHARVDENRNHVG